MQENPTITIPLGSKKYAGLFATVDEADFELVSQYNWHPLKDGNTFYAAAYIGKGKDRKFLSMHRLILTPSKNLVVDHINLNGLDNRRVNMRVCTRSENQRNRGGAQRNNESGYLGVCRASYGKWVAYIRVEGRYISKAGFDTPAQAAIVRDTLAVKYHGEYATLNFPDHENK